MKMKIDTWFYLIPSTANNRIIYGKIAEKQGSEYIIRPCITIERHELTTIEFSGNPRIPTSYRSDFHLFDSADEMYEDIGKHFLIQSIFTFR